MSKVTVQIEESELRAWEAMQRALEAARKLEQEIYAKYPIMKMFEDTLPAVKIFRQALADYDKARAS